MKKIVTTAKVVSIAIFGMFGLLLLMMFPFLIGDEDTATSMIGYGYLALLIISLFIVFLTVKNLIKTIQTN